MYCWYLLGSLAVSQVTIGPTDLNYDTVGLVIGANLSASVSFTQELPSANPISGVLTITQTVGSMATLTLQASGFVPLSTHGWVISVLMQHIHAGNATVPCTAAGLHFNPYNVFIYSIS
jgi:hypothetical protein